MYSRLDASYDEPIRALELVVLRALLVAATRAGRGDKARELFELRGDALLRGPDVAEWLVWMALPYLHDPQHDPRFKVCFSV